MTLARQALGLQGEELACRELRRRGYRILARRYRTRTGELDIVARHGEWVVFVEVKARQDGRFGDPEESVTVQKQRRLITMASDYLMRHNLTNAPCRFDVVGISTETSPPAITVLADAFRPGW